MTSISEDFEWEVKTTYQACQGTGVVQDLEEVPPRAQETRLGFSRITGGKSSRGMREVRAASGGSSPASMTESGWAEHGGVCG